MPDLGNAYVNIVPKAENISTNIEKVLAGGNPGAEKAGTGIGKRLLGAVAKLGIGAAVGSMLKQSFEAGGKLQQSFGGLETIYGDAAESAKAYAREAAAAGISANTYAEQAVSMGAALKAAFGGDTAAAAEAANTAIMDMADNAAKMGTPIESLQSAYQGFAKQNYTMLDNLKLGYGGTKQEMERLLADAEAFSGVKYDINNLGDVYSAIHVIQGELGLTGVAAEEAKTTLSGSAGAMKASWENLMGAMTTGEGFEQAMEGLTESVGNFASNVLSMLGNLAPKLPDLILGLADVVIANAPAFIAAGAELIVKLAAGLVERIPDIAAKVPEIWQSFKSAFSAIDWKSLGNNLINKIGDGINAMRTSLKTKFKTALTNAKSALSEIDWKGLGDDIIKGIINGLTGGAGSLYRKVRDIIKKALTSGQEEAETGSPSKLFARELGRWIPAGVAMGAEENMASLDRVMRGMIDGSVTSASQYASVAPAAAQEDDADRIIDALQRLRLGVVVELKGDAGAFLKVVNTENFTRTTATGYNRLAAAPAR